MKFESGFLDKSRFFDLNQKIGCRYQSQLCFFLPQCFGEFLAKSQSQNAVFLHFVVANAHFTPNLGHNFQYLFQFQKYLTQALKFQNLSPKLKHQFAKFQFKSN